MRKGEQARDEMVKDVNGKILSDGVEVRRISAEKYTSSAYFIAKYISKHRNILSYKVCR